MYTVAPVHDLGKVRQVHRTSIKPRIQDNTVLTESYGGQAERPPPLVMEDEIEEGDLAYVVVEGPQAQQGGAEGSRPPLEARANPASGFVGSASRFLVRGSRDGTSSQAGPGLVGFESPTRSERAPRRTGRAGQHSNRHHLPRTIGGAANQNSVSIAGPNSVMPWFRPWDQ